MANPTQRGVGRFETAWRVSALVLLLIVGGVGCSPLSSLSWFMAGDSLEKATFDLTVPDKESKVVFICAHGNPNAVSEEFRMADQMIASRLTNLLTQRYKENKLKISIVSTSKVNAYLHDHPGWVTKSKQDVGKYFGVDYVVYLELGPMSMYERSSNRSLLRGTVNMAVKVYSMQVGETESKSGDTFVTCIYPETQPEAITDTNEEKFRNDFLDRVAKNLAPLFVASPPKKNMDWN